MFCKHCGANVDDDSAFCSKCGGKLEIEHKTETVTKDIIEENDIVNAETNFKSSNCTLCGVLANVPDKSPCVPPPKEKSTLAKIAPFIVIAVAAFVGLAYAGGANKKANITMSSTTSIGSDSVSDSENALTPLEKMDKKHKNGVVGALIDWTLANASDYGTPSGGTSSSDLVDGMYMVGYNFKANNVFGTKVKHKLVAACDTSTNNCQIIMMKLDGETVYINESRLQTLNRLSAENQLSTSLEEIVSSSPSEKNVSSENSEKKADSLQGNKENLDFAIWCVNNYVADLTGKIIPIENSIKADFGKIENSENIKSVNGFNYSTTDDTTLRGVVVICELDKSGYLVNVEKIIGIDKDKVQTILYDSSTSDFAGLGIPPNATNIESKDGVLSYETKEYIE